MRFCSTTIDDRWVGILDWNGELYKVIFIPGSATKEWVAILQPTLFIELQSREMREAILKAKERLDDPQISTPSSIKQPNFPKGLMEQINLILTESEKEDGPTDPI